MDDKAIRRHIVDALDWDPSVDSSNIGVFVENGVAVLSGHVPNCVQQMTAEKIARRVPGVTAVADELEVYYFDAHSDADIASRAVRMLEMDVIVPHEAVSVTVIKGWVTLRGELDWDYQRRTAEADVRKLEGVVGLNNFIALKSRILPADLSSQIERALKRDAARRTRRMGRAWRSFDHRRHRHRLTASAA